MGDITNLESDFHGETTIVIGSRYGDSLVCLMKIFVDDFLVFQLMIYSSTRLK